MAVKQRPTGVTVLAILAAIVGILGIIGAVVLGIMATAMAEFIESAMEEYGAVVMPGAGEFLAAIVMAIAAVAAILGILALIDAYGLWIGASWAWWLTVILSVIGIILGLLSLPGGIIAIVIYALIIYYFTRPHVKGFFGMAAPSPPPPPPSP
ncbi:MAG: hypothetical protein ACUVRA_08545 [Candidatus Bathyarchaeaceae archaeon]